MQKRLSERLGRIVKARLWNPILFLALVASVSCRAQVEIEDISAPPEVAAEDKKYANVFQSLDGTWAGKFYIYVDERGQTGDRPQPRNLEESILQRLPLKLEDEIHVRQTYVSESPYFQRAKITDTYLNDQDTLKVVESYGANKVQNGKLWCVGSSRTKRWLIPAAFKATTRSFGSVRFKSR